MKSIYKFLGIKFPVFLSSSASGKSKKEVLGKDSLLIGEWDNFQQYWQENTEEEIHGIKTDDKHRHLSLKIKEVEKGTFLIEVREGRNGTVFIENLHFTQEDINKNNVELKGDTLFIQGENHFKNKDAYKFIRVRKFSGWIEYPITEDNMHHQGNLEIHDQGGMAALDVDGVDYTVELTQLIYGKKLEIMKLAIYDMPLDKVGINSTSISYTWVNPDAKRIGINLRKVISGWTLIEPGFGNQNTWREKEE
ncbi:hypothetical protein CLV91_1277 [Maribacter vaceletii]|uniref:Uncharacterized protein n=1 Tax=Maribacter vaceletii TaxID=1206816 RepID=A0A495EE78_9FLAO|nr:hypothetical protein [Maribacter vaceletii]RKR15195.1 hypothetical protein CLV91_1277 [Maribacter vaceletii]